MSQEISKFLLSLLKQNTSQNSLDYLRNACRSTKSRKDKNLLFFYFSNLTHFFEKKISRLEKRQIKKANELIKDWMPHHWTLLETSRAYFLLEIPYQDKKEYQSILNEILQTADLQESIALTKALPILPYSHNYLSLGKSILRTNIQPLFESMVHYNPYPVTFFDENTWNQMILKTIFIKVPLYPILHIDSRINKRLKDMLIDFAKECQSAEREVTPELWRCVGPFIEQKDLSFLKAIYTNPYRKDALAAGLALKESNLYEAKNILHLNSTLYPFLTKQPILWNNILLIKVN